MVWLNRAIGRLILRFFLIFLVKLLLFSILLLLFLEICRCCSGHVFIILYFNLLDNLVIRYIDIRLPLLQIHDAPSQYRFVVLKCLDQGLRLLLLISKDIQALFKILFSLRGELLPILIFQPETVNFNLL